MPLPAFSYNRYSSPQQSDGDSIRRQTALARAWCERNRATLDTAHTYEDRGRSAYHGKHRETGMLRRFLDDVTEGNIPRGSVLLIENMDRLSREKPVIGVNVLTGILLAGVRIVQLAPDEIELNEDSDLFSLFRGQMSQARGHEESKVKGQRVAEAWDQRQKRARESGERVTARLPAWLDIRGGTLAKTKGGRARIDGGIIQPVPARAKVVREIFRLAIEGSGIALIVRHLTETKVKTWGRGGAWSKAYVRKIITSRAVMGEYQPTKGGKPDGAPVANYYPVVIDADTWQRAQMALRSRRDKPGRVGPKAVALFSGLLFEAGTGEKLLVVNQTRGAGTKNRQKKRVIVTAGSMEGRERSVSFPLDVFEDSLRACIKEIDPADVLGGKPEGESTTLAAELARVKQSMEAIAKDMDANGESPGLMARFRARETEHAKLVRQYAEARAREKHPRAAALSEAKTLLDLPDDAATMLRLRQLIRDSVESVWVLVVPKPSVRVAAVQVHFDGGAYRNFIIGYKPARRGVKGETFQPRSFADAGLPAGRDLRDPTEAAKLERLLTKHADAITGK
jgi:DNA invertase Pin-like site-specific DNA recombinase